MALYSYLWSSSFIDLAVDEHISVSFSATGGQDLYVPQMPSLFRAVRITTKWFVILSTVGKLYRRAELLGHFSAFLNETTVDDESYWVLRAENLGALRKLVKTLPLDEAFRHEYIHEYYPEP